MCVGPGWGARWEDVVEKYNSFAFARNIIVLHFV